MNRKDKRSPIVGVAACCMLLWGLILAGCGSRSAAVAADVPAEPIPFAADVPEPPPTTEPPDVPEPTPTAGPPAVRVPILMYHHVALLKAAASAEWRQTTVTPAAFEEQMAYLRDHGYEAIHFTDLIAYFDDGRALPAAPVIITFDDAWDDGYLVAYPILKKQGLTATFFIPANWIGQVDGTLTWKQIEELAAGGMEIGSHTMTHPYLTRAKPDMLAWELENSRARLEKHVSQPVLALAYPFGAYDENVVAQAQAAGYRAGVTIEAGVWARAGTLMTLPRIGPGYDTKLELFDALLSLK